jgi:hypothetical protein
MSRMTISIEKFNVLIIFQVGRYILPMLSSLIDIMTDKILRAHLASFHIFWHDFEFDFPEKD